LPTFCSSTVAWSEARNLAFQFHTGARVRADAEDVSRSRDVVSDLGRPGASASRPPPASAASLSFCRCCVSPASRFLRDWDSWVEEIGLDPAAYGTHSIRRTKPSLIYRRTRNLRAVQLLLGHTKLESTVRYLGIEVEDALELAEQTEV
jgi:Phage integrase family